MLEKVLDYERSLFFTLNGNHTPFWDDVMYLLSGKIVWLPLAVFILIVLIYKKAWRESLLILLGIVLVVTLCDQFASHLCKPLFMRLRPTHHPDFMEQVQTVFGYRGGKYGFISSHAANAFGFAMYMAMLFRNKLFTFTIFIWATLMAYTRIYLGVHFISDIVPGIISGLVFGLLTYYLYIYIRRKVLYKGRGEATPPSTLYSETSKRSIVAAILLTMILILVFHAPLIGLLS